MDPRSETELAHICPHLAEKIRAAAAILAQEHTFFLVVSGLRTATQQDALYAQGRPGGPAGHIVTNARAGFSMHNYGLAADIVPFTTGTTGPLNWASSTPQFQRLVAALKEQGLEWGGDWKGNLGDFDHFQLTRLPASPSAIMRADYGHGPQDLSAIWSKAAAGTYAA